MALHGLASVTIGVPDVAATSAYYTDFGLVPDDDGWFSTADGGRQLRLVASPHRRLAELVVRAEGPDDLGRIAASLTALGVVHRLEGDDLVTAEPVSGSRVVVRVAPRLVERSALPLPPYNGPGRVERHGERAPGVVRDERVRPTRLGHAVLGSVDMPTSMRFFVDGLGFKVSDYISDHGAFMRCSDEHHNVLVLAAPVNFLHHTSWQVPDVDEVGRGATAMLDGHPDRHVWGLGRHHAGSNFFWYLKDPAGNFSEYFADMDCDIDDALWTPEVFHGREGLYRWGPPPPPSFLEPEDLADLMVGNHSGH
ncbi:VOC family protein [Actinomycetospora termitidis]|uniref:VOC family protein n=1 Tax=Actinomycetospora termitidis TaxID=3053470 RepID=A0ABT7MHH5_9PSEU|nr:VOC family protein [Actinomycetospora sp. Odt1-22]MDL5160111.1 VOC family protein [Actinomycetospora sp. Odt1-22]